MAYHTGKRTCYTWHITLVHDFHRQHISSTPAISKTMYKRYWSESFSEEWTDSHREPLPSLY